MAGKKEEKEKKEKLIGAVTHYFNKIGVAIVKLKSPVSKGDKLHFKGHTTDFELEANEMQFDHKDIEKGKKGQEIGLKVKEPVREHDEVFLVS